MDATPARTALSAALASKKRIAFFLDYDGTLREIEREPGAAIPTPAVKELLAGLSKVPRLDVTIISGRSRGDLERWLGLWPFRLIAEHGAALRFPNRADWRERDASIRYDWKQEIRPVLQIYADSTPGSFVEEKHSSLVWHYRKVEFELGRWKARQLAEELAAVTANEPVWVTHGKKMIEVSAAQVNKGAAVAQVLSDEAPFAIVLCAGDDHTDETMFELNVPNLISIKVGPGSTRAKFRLSEPTALRQFLAGLLERPECEQASMAERRDW